MEIKNMKTRMSRFWADILWFATLIPLFILNLKFDIVASEMWPSQFVFGIILGMLIFSKMALVHMELDESLNFKYKIIKKQYWYEVKVLRCWFWPIIFWQRIDEDYHSYKAQNMFGAKWDSGYTSDITYDTEKEARKAIEKYKNNAKEQRQEYFTKKKIFRERIKV